MKKNNKPIIYYWIIVLCIFVMLQTLLFPNLFSRQVEEVDYSTFMKMTENHDIGYVDIQDTQITFTDKSKEEQASLKILVLLIVYMNPEPNLKQILSIQFLRSGISS